MKSGSTTVSLSSGWEMSTIFDGSFIGVLLGAAPCAQASAPESRERILSRRRVGRARMAPWPSCAQCSGRSPSAPPPIRACRRRRGRRSVPSTGRWTRLRTRSPMSPAAKDPAREVGQDARLLPLGRAGAEALTALSVAHPPGAVERTRTSTGLPPLAPEASASTNSATTARSDGAAERTRTSTGSPPQRPQRCASTCSATAARCPR